MKKHENRVAIVTGAGSSIGLAIATRLAEEGARVVIADVVGAEGAAEGLRAAGYDALGVFCDVADEGSVSAMATATIGRFGAIDILVNNAAISRDLQLTPFEKLSVSDWQRILAVNTIGVFLCCRAVAPSMRARRYGRIVNITSGTAFKGVPFILHYVASKGAVMSMTRSLARELGSDNITVNAVSPGFTLSRGMLENAEFAGALRERERSGRALQRDAFEEDLTGSVSFLASDDAAFVSGQILAVDGGSVYH